MGSTYSGHSGVDRHHLSFISSRSAQLVGFSGQGSIKSFHCLLRLLELEPFFLTNSVVLWMGVSRSSPDYTRLPPVARLTVCVYIEIPKYSMPYYEVANFVTVVKTNMIDKMRSAYGILKTTALRIRHQVSRRASQRSQLLQYLTCTHSEVWSQLATTPQCQFTIGYRQSKKKRRNRDRSAICNAKHGIGTGRRVICHRGVSDSTDRAHPLCRSHSARTEMSFSDVEVDRVTGSIYSADPGVDRYHLISISSYHTMKIHCMITNFCSHSVCPGFCGSTQMCESSMPCSIISSHPICPILEPELLFVMHSVWMSPELQGTVDSVLPAYQLHQFTTMAT